MEERDDILGTCLCVGILLAYRISVCLDKLHVCAGFQKDEARVTGLVSKTRTSLNQFLKTFIVADSLFWYWTSSSRKPQNVQSQQ